MTDAILPLPALSPVCGKTVVAKFDGCESFRQVPKRIMLDDTFDAVHGGQQLRPFNAHYDEYGFQPIRSMGGRCVTAVLRRGQRWRESQCAA
jgi:hypothetical protein